MQEDFNEFSDLAETSYEAKVPTDPEEEFFHSIYVAGQTRKNHKDIVEQAGRLQIRGVDYNFDEINFVITNIKTVLTKTKRVNNQDSVECFSFQSGPWPWKGTSGKQCGKTSADRANDPFCNPCRSNIIVAGVYTDAKGNIIKNEKTGKPQFVFIRGAGVKYSNVSKYLEELYKLDLPLIFPESPGSKDFEKKVVNHKRFITKIKVGKRESKYGMKDVFELSKGSELPKANVMELLKVSKKLLPKFSEKFDWSLKKQPGQVSGYSQQSTPPDDSQKFDTSADVQKPIPPPDQELKEGVPPKPEEKWSFEDTEF
jgi:hypothetical protein